MAAVSSNAFFRNDALSKRLQEVLTYKPNFLQVEGMCAEEERREREILLEVMTGHDSHVISIIIDFTARVTTALNTKIFNYLHEEFTSPIHHLVMVAVSKSQYGGPTPEGEERRQIFKFFIERGRAAHIKFPRNLYYAEPNFIEEECRGMNMCIKDLPGLTREQKLIVKDIREATGQPVLPGDEDEAAFKDDVNKQCSLQ